MGLATYVTGIGRVVMIGMVNGGNVIGGGVVKLLVAVTGELFGINIGS